MGGLSSREQQHVLNHFENAFVLRHFYTLGSLKQNDPIVWMIGVLLQLACFLEA